MFMLTKGGKKGRKQVVPSVKKKVYINAWTI